MFYASKRWRREELRCLDELERPLWVCDLADTGSVWWGNRAARDADQADLRITQMMVSSSSLGEEGVVWSRGIKIEDGRAARLFQGSTKVEMAARRSTKLWQQLPWPIERVRARGGVVLERNAAAEDEFGESTEFVDRFVDPAVGRAFLKSLESVEARLRTRRGTRWFAVEATRHPCVGLVVSTRDIDERKARETAMAYNKSEFFAAMTYEIRTPLSGVVGFAELLAVTELTETQRGCLTSLWSSACAVMTILNDLLDLTSLEAGRMSFETVAFDPLDVVRGALQVVRPKAREAGLELRQETPEALPIVLGDPNRVRQILLNYLSNAIKFTPRDGSVTLKARVSSRSSSSTPTPPPAEEKKRRVRFEVVDTGPGLSPKDRAKLFAKFSQTDASVARKFGGTGLGLAICKAIAERLGGRVGVSSQVGRGSTFWLELPFDIVVDMPPPDNTTTTTTTRHRALPSPVDDDGTPSFRVLVVEDDASNQKLIGCILDKLGHTFHLIPDGQEALETIKTRTFDLVFMDFQMPQMGGLKATETIRALGYSRDELPIIGISADYRKLDHATYVAWGLNDCLGKPFCLPQIRAAIATWGGSASRRRRPERDSTSNTTQRRPRRWPSSPTPSDDDDDDDDVDVDDESVFVPTPS
ncbi:hypothetical protein CTAYLR_000960 [Chrysophaeum taylorii]|uniref:Uncharacterized protein n=1 Tax=Chrysophaeum taylorii TaxID=2483200 RepID=A0AAD7UHP6_9STRA|nr:hypothetical protein CTAYLR_000960 [Chrysophaeum taylorii]